MDGAEFIFQFKNFVEVSPFADGDNWFLTQSLDYEIRNTGVHVPVPRGFVTDFASIPRPFWSVLPRWGKYGPAAVVHDYLYWDQRCTREQADRMLYLSMQESSVNWFWRLVIYRAVHWGGYFAWKNNAALRASGRTREIPEDYPLTDPTATWEQVQRQLFEQGHRPKRRPSEEPPPSYCAEISAIPLDENVWRAP
jgi:hypothetical protein